MNLYFDEDSQKLIVNAKNEMYKLKHPYVGSEHLFLAILHNDSLDITNSLKEYGITYDNFREKLISSVGVGSKENDWFLFTPLLKKILINVVYYVEDHDKIVRPYHLLLAIFKEGDGVANRILVSMNIDLDVIYDKFLFKNLSFNCSKRKLLDTLAVNMNKKYIDECFDPVIGRDMQIQQIIRTLLRKNKNNPLLIGEAGVGKTAIVEELVHLIVTEQVPLRLRNVTVYNLSMASLVAGTKYRGEFEEKLQKLIEEIKNDSKIILFIDEIHTLVGAGGADGAIDASNILKPYLARGEIKIIGATTISEYSKFIENDKALDRRFQKIYIEETSEKELENIFKCLVPMYEKFHNVNISKKIVSKIISFSSIYILNGKQPDKAIDLLDEVCVYVISKKNKKEKMLNQYAMTIKSIEKDKKNCVIHRDFKKAKNLKLEVDKLYSKYNKLLFSDDNKVHSIFINEHDLEDVIYYKTGIPIGNKWFKKVSYTFCELKKVILGQNDVLKQLSHSFYNVNYFDKEKILSFLFVGKNGVGKTFLAQELGGLFVGKNHCYIFYMNEFREEQSIYKFTGPSRISFFNSIRERPFSVLIFDSIDQAHPSIISFLLKILDDGMLLTYDGEVYNLSKCIFIFTANVVMNGVGFSSKVNFSASLNKISNKVQNTYYFKPITKRVIKKYIVNYCNKNNCSNINYDLLIDSILLNYDYDKLGFSKLSCQIEKYLEEI